MQAREVTVDRPAPGTPPDSLYAHPTAPGAAHPYAYPVSDADYAKPQTVYPALGGAPRAAAESQARGVITRSTPRASTRSIVERRD
jgi:hypothetical protein